MLYLAATLTSNFLLYMNTNQDIKNQQESTWNKFSSGWKKWDNQNNTFTGIISKTLVNAVPFKSTDHVLDIASGTGEPGISIAANKVPQGRVELTDISQAMLDVAGTFAADRNVTNIGMHRCSVDELPFANDTFDAVTCRFGFMFFPDIAAAIQELKRVMKPGAMLSTAVWSTPAKNIFASLPNSIINRNVEMPAPQPGSPGMFRCAAPGYLTGLFEEQGFTDVTEQEVLFSMNTDSIDTYWKFTTELAAPVVAAMAKADEATKAKIKEEVFAACEQYMQDGKFSIPAAALVITARKSH